MFRTLILGAFSGVVLACNPSKVETPELQGIVELTERSLAFELSGQVLDVQVQRGDILEKGATIALLDSTLEELQYKSLRAQARATKAELDLLYEGTRREDIERGRARVRGTESSVVATSREWDRIKLLYESDSISRSELDSARSQLDVARANRDEARETLVALRDGPRSQEIEAGEARLEAAEASAASSKERINRHLLLSDGLAEVLDVPTEFGEYVSAGTSIVTVADTSRPFVEIFVPQERINEVKLGYPVTIMTDALKDVIGGRVEHIARTMEYTPRFLFSPKERPYLVLRVRIRIEDPNRKIHAGIPAFIELHAPPDDVPLPPKPQVRTPKKTKSRQAPQ